MIAVLPFLIDFKNYVFAYCLNTRLLITFPSNLNTLVMTFTQKLDASMTSLWFRFLCSKTKIAYTTLLKE